jgi:hypothetical protein
MTSPRHALSLRACFARIARGATGAGLAGVVAMGCGSSFPPPPLVPQTDDAFSEVPYPPPPAQIEFVPDVPDGNVAWVDGAWTWEGTQWRWKRGGWFSVPPGTAYAPWQAKRTPDGRLLFAPAVWRTANGAPLEPPEPVAPALSGKALQRKKDAPQKGAPSQKKAAPAQPATEPAQPPTEPAQPAAEPPQKATP